MSESITLTKLSGLLRSGISMDKAIEHIGGIPGENLGLRYLLEISMEAGVRVANEIDVVAELCYQREKAAERIRVAYAGPKSSSRLLIWLPVITLLTAQITGFDLFSAVKSRPVLLCSIGLGVLLLLLARLISKKLLSGAEPKESYLGFYLMGIALATAGGVKLHTAQNLAFESYRRIFSSEPAGSELRAMAEIANLVELTGARVSDLLRAQAMSLHREVLVANEIRIEKLGVKLMVPLGLAVLPAFICLAVIPLLGSMFGPN